MHATDAERLTCLSCGYDLRAAATSEKCPECGFPVRDSIIGHARSSGRWAWKVRIGLVLMLVAAPFLIVAMLTYTQIAVIGVPLTALNFPGPKAWGGPLVRMWTGGNEEAAASMICLIINTLGIYLLTTPATTREPMMTLRRWLRVYTIAAVPFVWFFVTPWFGWPRLPGEGLYHALIALALIEVPGTTLLYFYLARLARDRLVDPRLARRSTDLLKGILPLQILGVVAVSQMFALDGPVTLGLVIVYGAVAISLGLWSVDIYLDLYRALGDIERSESPR